MASQEACGYAGGVVCISTARAHRARACASVPGVSGVCERDELEGHARWKAALVQAWYKRLNVARRKAAKHGGAEGTGPRECGCFALRHRWIDADVVVLSEVMVPPCTCIRRTSEIRVSGHEMRRMRRSSCAKTYP